MHDDLDLDVGYETLRDDFDASLPRENRDPDDYHARLRKFHWYREHEQKRSAALAEFRWWLNELRPAEREPIVRALRESEAEIARLETENRALRTIAARYAQLVDQSEPASREAFIPNGGSE